MKRTLIFFGLLLSGVTALALMVRGDSVSISSKPSVDNPGPKGFAALYRYLKTATKLSAPLTEIPPEARVVVVHTRGVRSLTADETKALASFVDQGGTLVLLSGAPVAGLKIVSGQRLAGTELANQAFLDPLGTTATVWRPFGLFAGASRLRFLPEAVFSIDAKDALPIAGVEQTPAVWWQRRGTGEIWLVPREMGENARIELEDNLVFWANLSARGPVAFDEWHLSEPPASPVAGRLGFLAIQLLACAAMLFFAQGTRLGPPRPELGEQARSSLEYLRSFAHLTRQARVEKDLLAEMAHSLRVLFHDRAGIPVTLPDTEVARELRERWDVPEETYLALIGELGARTRQVSPADYARLSRECAALERLVEGRA